MNHPDPYPRRSALAWLKTPLLAASLGLAILTGSMGPADAMDTDIFAGQNAAGSTPNVLIVLDNTADWANNSQHWVDAQGKPEQQGQAEVNAIKQVIQNLPGNINIGLMEMDYVHGGDGGGFTRFAISPLGQAQTAGPTNVANFTNILTAMHDNGINGNASESAGQKLPLGDLMRDAYNYFSGLAPFASPNNLNSSTVDSRGYTTPYTLFKSPLSPDTSCASTYIIFIGNAGTLHSDSPDNTNALQALGGASAIAELPLPGYTSTTQQLSTNLGYSAACYTSPPTGTPADYASQCPSASTTYDSCTYSSSDTNATLAACPSGSSRYSIVGNGPSSSTTSTTTVVVNSGVTTACYANTNQWSSTDASSLPGCPANSTTTSGSTTTSISYSCTTPALGSAATASSGSCNGNQTKYNVSQTVTKTQTAVTQLPPGTFTAGTTSACYTSQSSCTTAGFSCPAGDTCSCGSPVTQCAIGTRYQVLGNQNVTMETPTGFTVTDTSQLNMDEWARYLHGTGIPVTDASGNVTHQTVSTYTVDVYKDQPNTGFSELMAGTARAGGGKYFAALSDKAIVDALTSIFSEIQAVNSTFASAALPISATNRAQNANQVYIGMFRPDQTDHPRWFGNLKRYQVDTFNGTSDLGGADGKSAVSATTGFVTPCALSWWTTDVGNYWYDTTLNQNRIFITQAVSGSEGLAWQSATDDTNFAKGTCGTTGTWSDNPDGPTVEKGAAAEMLRTQTGRTMYTVPASTTSTTSLTAFNTTNVTGISPNSVVNANVVKFIMGQDVTGEIAGLPSTSMRPSIHGEVIHSRPLPVDYGGSTGVVVYYGAGDGVFHAVSGNNGQELWSFVAPESYPQLQRLMDNSPLIQAPYPTPPGQTQLAGTTSKPFFFDGSTGQYQNADNSKVWIYPAMRRGGRMLYSFDVTTPTAPTLKWRVGCPDLGDQTGCTPGLEGIGQTWSTPQLANVNGYKVGGSNAPVVIVGGGYDGCEDADSATPSCGSPKGAKVYVLDADNGSVIATFNTDRSVIADLALVDLNGDGIVDAAYAADTGGNIYRVDFPTTATDTSTWAIHKVAYTNVTPGNSYRKFEFEPAVLPYKGKVYVAISSGDREHPLSASYPYTTPVVNRFYVYLDDPSRTTATDLDGVKMLDQTANPPTCASSGILPGGSSFGWHMDLNSYGTGEQGVTSPIILGGMVSFSTNRPVVSGAMCTTSLGEARGYWVNLLNGSGAIGVNGTCGGALSATFVGGGLPPSPVAATVNVDGKNQTIVIGSVSRSGGSSSAISAQQVRPPISNKRNRTYWRDNTDTR